jgi:hypothetical protein
LACLENQTSLFANGTFSEEDGELVLTIPGGISEVRLLPGKNGNAVDSTGSGVVREREALRTLSHNGWIDATVEGTTLKIRLGAHAKKIRAGKEEVQATAWCLRWLSPSFRHVRRKSPSCAAGLPRVAEHLLPQPLLGSAV